MKRFIITAALLLAGSPARAADLGKEKLPAGTKVARDVAYVAGGHARQKLDVYWSADGKPRPLIVWVHGGGFSSGDKADGISLAPLGWGYAMASVNYRLSGDAKFPAQVEDCKAAVRWLRANAKKYNLDPDRVGAWGSSAGGHLVALLGTSGHVKEFDVGPHLKASSRVQAACDFFGPSDFTRMPRADRADSPEGKLFGGPVPKRLALARQASPLTHVAKDVPPFLIFHGDADKLVPLEQSELLAKALKKAGGDVTFVPIKGVGHERMEVWKREKERVRTFFDKHLLKKGRP